MKLIIESGATKADWILIAEHPMPLPENKGESCRNGDYSVQKFQTEGLNFSSGDEEFVFRTLELASLKVMDIADAATVEEVHLYAAGLFPSEDPESPYQLLKASLTNRFPGAGIHLENDLLAAARALFGNKPGIACILGTGSNTCLYDGTNITRKISSGGFILGDEGSAGALGKHFIEDLIKGLVPECVVLAFKEKYDLEYSAIVHQVYHSSSPAAYLGKFAPDILAFYDSNDYMRQLVDENFRSFIKRCILPCLGSATPIGVVGGFGYACRNILEAIGREEGIVFEKILKSPSEQLIEYHCKN